MSLRKNNVINDKTNIPKIPNDATIRGSSNTEGSGATVGVPVVSPGELPKLVGDPVGTGVEATGVIGDKVGERVVGDLVGDPVGDIVGLGVFWKIFTDLVTLFTNPYA